VPIGLQTEHRLNSPFLLAVEPEKCRVSFAEVGVDETAIGGVLLVRRFRSGERLASQVIRGVFGVLRRF